MSLTQIPRAREPRLSIIIPSSFRPELLPACLASLARFAAPDIPFETIVVLNEAAPDAERSLRATTRGVEVTSSGVNLGLAGACNRGRSLARGELLIVLHDDAEVEAGWLEALVEAADAHPEAGAIGGKVLHPDGRLQSAGMILWRDGTTSAPWIGEAPAPTAFDELRAVDYCGTSSLLVRAWAWDAIGGLDEQMFPLYYVDVDLSIALRRRLGRVVLYEPRSRIRHHQGASAGSARYRWWITQRNQRLLLDKWGELEEHEPSDGTALALERAVARPVTFAERCRGALRPLPPPLSVAHFDAQAQERRYSELGPALQKAYVAHLTELLEAAERDVAGLRSLLAAQRADAPPGQ